MNIKYFEDTDTTLVELGSGTATETRELSENIYADFDASGNVVSITVEHASEHTELSEFSYVRMKGQNELKASA